MPVFVSKSPETSKDFPELLRVLTSPPSPKDIIKNARYKSEV